VTVLITGAAGGVGSFLRRGLPAFGWELRCLDLVPPREVEHDGLRWMLGDIADPELLDRAMRGVEAVVHLAGIPTEVPEFAPLLHSNIDGTYQVFEAARRNGVARVLYASSNHAVGCHEASAELREDAVVRPDSTYGVTKAFGEALGSYYVDKHGLAVACLRIGSCFERPTQVRHLATWLSPGDAVRLTDALLRAPGLRYATVNGISANTRAWWSLETARALGYRPQDDAERYADELLATLGELSSDDPDARYAGGRMAARP
jgi:uronate dehydrogenase